MEKNFDYSVIENHLFELVINQIVSKNITFLGNFQKKLLKKTFKITRQESRNTIDTDFMNAETLLKAEISKRNDNLFKSVAIENGNRYYIEFKNSNRGSLENKQFGIVLIDVLEDTENLTLIIVNVFSRGSMGMYELPLDVVENAYSFVIKNRTNMENDNLSEKIESIYHSNYIDYEVLKDNSYLSPQCRQMFEDAQSEIGYDSDSILLLKRKLKNTYIMANNKNIFSSELQQPTNIYQEKIFPPIDKKVDLEEFTTDYVWEDEICYFYSMVEYLEYEIQGGDRMFMSTNVNIGYSNIRAVSEIDTGADDMIWRRKACGEFYVTENGIIIYDKGYQTKLEKAAGIKGYPRRVIKILFSDIDIVHGVLEHNMIKIVLKNGEVLGLQSANLKRKGMPFTNEENIYLVNLIASIVLHRKNQLL